MRLSLEAAGCVRAGAARLLLHLRLCPAEAAGPFTFRVTAGKETLFSAPLGPGESEGQRNGSPPLPRDLLLPLDVARIGADGWLALDFTALPAEAESEPETGAEPDEETAAATGPAPLWGLEEVALLDPRWSNPLARVARSDLWAAGDRPLFVDFSDPVHRAALAPGLAFHPAWGLGAAGGRIALLLPLLPGHGARRLELGLRPVAGSGRAVRARILWNGQEIGGDSWTGDDPAELSLDLPPALAEGPGPALLEIRSETAIARAGGAEPPPPPGADPRILGLGLTDLRLFPGTGG
ncbi:hypothetical protein E0K89_022345 [Aquicoccus sp. SCR17]|nr:hypothetical protein [Carideicomes alvinocaridis]